MKPLIAAGVAVWMLATAASADILTIRLTAFQQGLNDAQVRASRYKSSVTQIRITTRDILDFIAAAYATNFPPGAMLSSTGGSAQVLDARGNVLLNVDPAVFRAGSSSGVYSGVERAAEKGSYQENGYSPGYLLLNVGNTNRLQLGGFVMYRYYEDYWSGRYWTGFNMSAAGEGSIDGDFAVLTGKIAGKGSGVVNLSSASGAKSAGDSSGYPGTVATPDGTRLAPEDAK